MKPRELDLVWKALVDPKSSRGAGAEPLFLVVQLIPVKSH